MVEQLTLLKSFDRIKVACDFQSLSPGAAAITFKEEYAYAKNLTLMAKMPFPGVEDCIVAAREFGIVVRAFPRATHARVLPKSLVVEEGQSRGKVPRIFLDQEIEYDDVTLTMRDVPDGFGEAVLAVAPFVSKDRTRAWTMGARIDGDKIVATNNIVLVEATMREDSGVGKVTLSNSLVDFIAANHKTIRKWGISNREIRFQFSHGGWVRGARLNGEMPDRVPAMLESFPDLPLSAKKDALWSSEILERLAFAEGLITVDRTKISGQRDGLVLECNIATTMPDQALVFGQELLAVVKHATEIDFTSESHIPFRGNNFRGIMASRRSS